MSAGGPCGIYATIAIAGSAFGLVLGGFLTQYVNWRWCLYVNLPIAGARPLRRLDDDPQDRRRTTAGSGWTCWGSCSGAAVWWPLSTRSVRRGTSGWGGHRRHRRFRRRRGAARRVHRVAEQRSQSPAATRCSRNRNHAGSFVTILLAVTGMFRDVPVPHVPAANRRSLLPPQGRGRLPPPHGDESHSPGHTGGQPPDAPRAAGDYFVVPGLLLAAVGVALFTQLTPDAALRHERAAERAPPRLRARAGHRALHLHGHPQNAEPQDVGVTAATTTPSPADRGIHRHHAVELASPLQPR